MREVHINRDRVPMETRRRIRDVMEMFEWVFTTSYDLLAYWAIAVDGKFEPFKDHFRYGGRLEFDPERATVYSGEVPVYFLHGALHLVVSGDRVTWKLRRTAMDTLLDQFGQAVHGDPRARPLLVTEGSAVDKLRVIDGNDYLRHGLDLLYERDLPVVVFGSGLSSHDAHISEALMEHPDRPIAVSMLPAPKGELLAKQVDIYGRLEVDPLIFFNAETHPLGDPALGVPAPVARRLRGGALLAWPYGVGVGDLAGAVDDPNLAAAVAPHCSDGFTYGVALGRSMSGRPDMALFDHIPSAARVALLDVARVCHPRPSFFPATLR